MSDSSSSYSSESSEEEMDLLGHHRALCFHMIECLAELSRTAGVGSEYREQCADLIEFCRWRYSEPADVRNGRKDDPRDVVEETFARMPGRLAELIPEKRERKRKRKREESDKRQDASKSARTGLTIYATVHPACAGQSAGSTAVIDVLPDAVVGDISRGLKATGATNEEPRIRWQGRELLSTEVLADIGLCPQSTVEAMPPPVMMGICSSHCSVLLSTGAVLTWGYKVAEELQFPVHIPSRILRITANESETVAVLDDGSVAGWGREWHQNSTIFPSKMGGKAVQAEKGQAHTIVLLDDGRVWLQNDWCDEALQRPGATMPVIVGKAVQVRAGWNHSMVLTEDGTIYCWGNDHAGDVPPLTKKPVQISAGFDHCVALLEDGEVICWGNDTEGSCTVPTLHGRVLEVQAGGYTTAALMQDGSIVCWGGHAGVYHFGRCLQMAVGELGILVQLEDGSIVGRGKCKRVPQRLG
eukprot:Hpha_TRINITY_DN4450_c0_g1::TRINITY_DN4450_c0_g1_i1::g.50542::m.50542